MCTNCISKGIQFIHLAILALSSDCEGGNKRAMEVLLQNEMDGIVDPQLEDCVFLPHAVHVGKSIKCSFSNWFCLLDGYRLALSVVHTLRDDSNLDARLKLENFFLKKCSEQRSHASRTNPVRVQVLRSGLIDARCVDYLPSKRAASSYQR